MPFPLRSTLWEQTGQDNYKLYLVSQLLHNFICNAHHSAVAICDKHLALGYYTRSRTTRTRLYQIIAYFEGHLPHQKSLH